MFVIQTGIPVPVYTPAGRPGVDYPFADLQVGSCFFVPVLGEETPKQVLSRVRAKSQRWKKQSGLLATKLRVSISTNPQTAELSIGVWRTA